MLLKPSLLLAVLLLIAGRLNAQAELQLSVSLLANDKIAEVNVDQEGYVKNVGEFIDLVRSEFKGLPASQKLEIVFVSHKTGAPSVRIYSRPQLAPAREQHFLLAARALPIENTKLVDFPMMVNVNAGDGPVGEDFKDVVLPTDSVLQAYEHAGLREKYAMNKAWVATCVLPVLAAYEQRANKQFAGVTGLGNAIARTNFSRPQPISSIITQHPDYWRAVMEMARGNEIIPATKIFAHVSQGELDYAHGYLEIVQMFTDTGAIVNQYLSELNWRLSVFNKQLTSEVEQGTAEHDKGHYDKAVHIYQQILAEYPNSAWAAYELYYSQNAADVATGKVQKEDRKSWDKAKVGIYQSNPLYHLDVRASNGREAYLMFRRTAISELFKTEGEQLNDVYKYGEIAMDLGVYDFAAQLFWYSFTYSEDNKKALNRYLYCLERLGVKNLKENFKGDFPEIFKKIDANRDEEMKGSSIYQSFKNGE